MITKTLRNFVAAAAVGGTMLVPAVTTIAPQVENMACNYPNSIVTNTDIVAPTVVRDHTANNAVVNVDAGGMKPNGRLRFKVQGRKPTWVQIRDGEPASFSFGGAFKAGRTYKLRAKFHGACRYRNSSDQMIVTVVK